MVRFSGETSTVACERLIQFQRCNARVGHLQPLWDDSVKGPKGRPKTPKTGLLTMPPTWFLVVCLKEDDPKIHSPRVGEDWHSNYEGF